MAGRPSPANRPGFCLLLHAMQRGRLETFLSGISMRKLSIFWYFGAACAVMTGIAFSRGRSDFAMFGAISSLGFAVLAARRAEKGE